jgi:hypothetical protein
MSINVATLIGEVAIKMEYYIVFTGKQQALLQDSN